MTHHRFFQTPFENALQAPAITPPCIRFTTADSPILCQHATLYLQGLHQKLPHRNAPNGEPKTRQELAQEAGVEKSSPNGGLKSREELAKQANDRKKIFSTIAHKPLR